MDCVIDTMELYELPLNDSMDNLIDTMDTHQQKWLDWAYHPYDVKMTSSM